MGGSGLTVRFSSLAGLLGLVALLAGISAHAGATAQADHPTARDARIPGHYLVVLDDSIAHPGDIARAQVSAHDGRLGYVYSYALKGYSAELSKGAVEALRRDPRVAFVNPDHRMEAFAQSIPTGFARVYALENENLAINEVNDVGVNADVAVLDTGVDSSHPELNVLKLIDCTVEAVCLEGKGKDENGHGTHVAGTLGAKDNTFGVVGVGLGVRIWSVKVLPVGEPTEAMIVAGVNWVTSKAGTIEVANMSLGCECSAPTLEKAIVSTRWRKASSTWWRPATAPPTRKNSPRPKTPR